MSALPKAISQGSKAGGGGALTAFNFMSAATAEPDTIASAVANKTSFFMTIPITFKTVQFRGPPRASDNRLQPNSLTRLQSGTRRPLREAKKSSICRLFRRYGGSTKGCPPVWHSNNNFRGFVCPLTYIDLAERFESESRRSPKDLES